MKKRLFLISALCASFNGAAMNTQPSGPCRAIATAIGDDLYALQFELHNSGASAIELPSHEPFTSFDLRASADGKPLPVSQPALDVGIRETVLRMLPDAALTLATPIRLRLAEGAAPGTDGWVWTIAHAKEGLSLQVSLALPAPFAGPWPVLFA